jgi:Ca2+-binding RTX toxin-like protein
VTVTDRLPAQTYFVSASASSGNCERSGRRVTCRVGSLSAAPGPGEAATITVQAIPTRVGTVENTASVDSVENDLVSFNDSATASTQVVAAPRTGSCRGVVATIVGTPRGDSLTGTGGPDVIMALDGNDAIAGLGGRDLICAAGGNDRVTAGAGADRVFSGGGHDRLLGRGGPDLLAGDIEADILAGNRGADRLRGGRGADVCLGGAGLDRLRGCER